MDSPPEAVGQPSLGLADRLVQLAEVVAVAQLLEGLVGEQLGLVEVKPSLLAEPSTLELVGVALADRLVQLAAAEVAAQLLAVSAGEQPGMVEAELSLLADQNTLELVG